MKIDSSLLLYIATSPSLHSIQLCPPHLSPGALPSISCLERSRLSRDNNQTGQNICNMTRWKSSYWYWTRQSNRRKKSLKGKQKCQSYANSHCVSQNTNLIAKTQRTWHRPMWAPCFKSNSLQSIFKELCLLDTSISSSSNIKLIFVILFTIFPSFHWNWTLWYLLSSTWY